MDEKEVAGFLKEHSFDALVSSLPYFCNEQVAQYAKKYNMHYFDLTEDVACTESIKKLSADAETAFVPQCGLAPGYVGIVANDLMKHFDQLDTVKLRVGALPTTPSNILKYNLNWSTDGLINEYGNPCLAIKDYKFVQLQPLEGLESLSIDGLSYECFNTSGGLATLGETYEGKVRDLTYKTIRYPGHCKTMRLLMNSLRLNHDRDTLKRILENAIPRTFKDVVLIYVSVIGKQHDQLIEENYITKIYGQKIGDKNWAGIQITTASCLCAVLDIVLSERNDYRGFVRQEQFKLKEVLDNRFGEYYAQGASL